MPDVIDWYGKGMSDMVNNVLRVSARSVICYNDFIRQYGLQSHSVTALVGAPVIAAVLFRRRKDEVGDY